MREELCLFIWICSIIICCNWLQDVNESNFDPSVVLMSSDHQEEDLTLKSPLTRIKYGFLDLYVEAFSQNSAKIR